MNYFFRRWKILLVIYLFWFCIAAFFALLPLINPLQFTGYLMIIGSPLPAFLWNNASWIKKNWAQDIAKMLKYILAFQLLEWIMIILKFLLVRLNYISAPVLTFKQQFLKMMDKNLYLSIFITGLLLYCVLNFSYWMKKDE